MDAAGLDGLLDGLGAEVTCPYVCQVAMFLSTATDLPNTGDSAHIARSAMACCREILCGKFHTEESCQWISSGDTTWKSDLSSDLDQVEVTPRPPSMSFPTSFPAAASWRGAAHRSTEPAMRRGAAAARRRQAIDERLRQISSDDLDDPDAQNERASLLVAARAERAAAIALRALRPACARRRGRRGSPPCATASPPSAPPRPRPRLLHLLACPPLALESPRSHARIPSLGGGR
jgi:hypothetical protein